VTAATMTFDEITNSLQNDTTEERFVTVSHLCDLFESYNRDIDHFNELMDFLIDLSINTDDRKLKTELLEAICVAETYQNTDAINFDGIERDMDSVQVDYLPRYIDILAYTHDRKYIEAIHKYKNHDSESVRRSARNAIMELGTAHKT
jgi:hypothetical protein